MKNVVYIPNLLTLFKEELSDFVLTPERQERAKMLFNDLEKQRFIAAEWATQKYLRQCFGITDLQICGKVSEKPYIKNHDDICFSRSYCGNGLVVAVENAERIGADCELIKPVDDAVMKYFFTEREKAFVQNSSDQDFAFTLIWTKKESYVKYIGEGLHYQWDLLDVTPAQLDLAHSPLSRKNDPVGDFYINSYLIENIVLSICSQNNDQFPSVIQEWRSDEKNNH